MPPTGLKDYDDGNYDFVIGVDEVGFGAWAGPLVVCMVVLPRWWTPTGPLGDSKALSPAQREEGVKKLLNDTRVTHILYVAEPSIIDADGLGKTLRRLHQEAVEGGVRYIHHVHGVNTRHIAIVDGNVPIPGSQCLVKADSKVPAVSAASIIAKVHRDKLMVQYDQTYPGFGFKNHKGYGTPEHQRGLDKLGPCKIHRMSYAPVAAAVRPV